VFLHVWQTSSGWHVSALKEALISFGIRNTIINSPLKLKYKGGDDKGNSARSDA